MKQIRHESHSHRRNERGSVRLWVMIGVAAVVCIAALALWPERDTNGGSGQPSADVDSETHGRSGDLYTCGMHPQVLSETPGTCPICQMDLTPVKVEHGSATKTASSGERRVKFWRAPMDPNFISDQPGKSPMGMDLIPVYEDEAAEEGDMAITISPVVVQNMGVRTAPVQKKAVVKTVRTLCRLHGKAD
jgi:Cu(I)/Ag(I) efflux system membrane fusion protein/cobalt-zinc-cadmium efflux system membrane fusion protein